MCDKCYDDDPFDVTGYYYKEGVPYDPLEHTHEDYDEFEKRVYLDQIKKLKDPFNVKIVIDETGMVITKNKYKMKEYDSVLLELLK